MSLVYLPCSAALILARVLRSLTYLDASRKAVTAGAGMPVAPNVAKLSISIIIADALLDVFITPGGAV